MNDLFSGGVTPLNAQIACVQREIKQRERVYPRWVSEKKMTQVFADFQIKAMRDVLRSLEALRGKLP